MLDQNQAQSLQNSQRKRRVVGKLIAKYRKKSKLSQLALSQLLGYQYTVVTHWENGTHRVPRKSLLELQVLLHIPGAQLKAFLDDPEVVVAEHLHKPTGNRVLPGLGERMLLIRKHLDLSTDDMALLLDMSRTQYNRVELARSNLTLTQLVSAERMLPVSFDQLLGKLPLLLTNDVFDAPLA